MLDLQFQTIRIRTAVALCAWLIIAACVSAHADDQTDEAFGILTLVNGDKFPGQLRASESNPHIRWHSKGFVDAFAFRSEAVQSATFPTRMKYEPQDEFVIQLRDGDIVTGDIVDWQYDRIVCRAESIGNLAIATDAIRHIHRRLSADVKRVQFVTDLNDWKTVGWSTDGWSNEGEFLSTTTPGTSLNGNFDLPHRSLVDLEVSWSGDPDFVIAIGTDPGNEIDNHMDGWRLETVDQELIAVREQLQKADIDVVRDLKDRQRIRLLASLDQIAGRLTIRLPTGEKIAQVDGIPASDPGKGIRLINRGESLRVHRVRITDVGKERPDVESDAGILLVTKQKQHQIGAFESFDVPERVLTVDQESNPATVSLADLEAAYFFPDDPATEHQPAEFRLRCGALLSGHLERIDDQHWVLRDKKFMGQCRIPRDQIQRVSLRSPDGRESETWTVKPGSKVDGHRIGRISLDTYPHYGWITDSSQLQPEQHTEARPMSITWQPMASQCAARLEHRVSGRIIYDPSQSSSRPGRLSQMSKHNQVLRRVGDKSFGTLFLDSVDRIESRRARRDQNRLHLITGDVIPCRVDSIDESGVRLSTLAQDDVLVAHRDIKAIELVAAAGLPELSQAKKERLLTIPRLQKSSPPTHILASADGDLLRCRLIRADEKSIDVEVQMDKSSVARSRVSHIIWLHPDGQSAEPKTNQRYQGLVQAVWFDHRRMTFRPNGTTKTQVTGKSRILGDCVVDIDKVGQIILGDQLEQESKQLLYSDWELTDAPQPLIMRGVDEAKPSVDASELVGRSAPNVLLERLDGGSFNLDRHRGKVVVLDFWASWSAPCMKRIPQLHTAVAKFGSSRVALVGVNIEEQRDLIRQTLDQAKLDMIVAMDIDGDVASAYHANDVPYTVVIDGKGKIADVIIGNDRSALENIIAAVDRSVESTEPK